MVTKCILSLTVLALLFVVLEVDIVKNFAPMRFMNVTCTNMSLEKSEHVKEEKKKMLQEKFSQRRDRVKKVCSNITSDPKVLTCHDITTLCDRFMRRLLH